MLPTDRAIDTLLPALAVALVAAGRDADGARVAGTEGHENEHRRAACLAALRDRTTGGDLTTLPALLREAAIDALQLIADLYAAGVSAQTPDTDGAPRAFIAAARTFCDHQRQIARARGATWRPEPWLMDRNAAEQTATIGGGERQSAPLETIETIRRDSMQALLSELDLAIGPWPIPDGFLRRIQAHGRTTTGWFDAFTLYAVASIAQDAQTADTIDAIAQAHAGISLDDLTRIGRDIAVRFDQCLKRPEHSDDGNTGHEIAGYLERVPRDLASHCGAPEAAVRRIARRLMEAGIAPVALEARLDEHIALLRLAPAFARSPGLSEIAPLRADLARHVAAGRFDVAISILEDALAKLDSNEVERPRPAQAPRPAIRAELQWACGLCQALRGDPGSARTLIDDAIATLGDDETRSQRRYRLTLAHALAVTGSPAAAREAVQTYATLLREEAIGETATLLVPAALGLAACIQRLARPQRHIRWPTLAAQTLHRLLQAPVPALPARTRAELWLAFADICGVLAQSGAERRDEMREALRTAVTTAREATDVRLECHAHLRLADSQPPGEGAADEQTARQALVAALSAAQVPGLRLRDPITWAMVKLRIGEAMLSHVNDTTLGAQASLPSAIVALKAALRILPSANDTVAFSRAATTLGEAYMRLVRIDRRDIWRRHAQAAFARALERLTADATPLLFADTHVRIAGALLGADPDEQDVASLEAAVGHYQTAILALQPPTQRWAQARRALADTLIAIGRRRFDLDRLEEAAAIHRGTLAATTEADLPLVHCQCWIGLAAASREQARLTERPEVLDEPLAQLARLEPELADRGPPWLIATLRTALREARETQHRLSGAARPAVRQQPPPLPQHRRNAS